MKIAKSTLSQLFVNEFKADHFVRNGYDNWMLPEGTLITIKSSTMRVPFEELEIIAEIQLRISPWEFDYLLGKYGIN